MSWKKWLTTFSRFLSCGAALVIMYNEASASIGNKSVLFGSYNGEEASNAYPSPLIAQFLFLFLNQPQVAQEMVNTIFTSDRLQVVYLDLDNQDNLAIFPSSCNSSSTEIDYLYQEDIINLLVRHGLAKYSINITGAKVLIDCSYLGRASLDSTCIKFHILHKETFTTVVIQTISIERIAKKLISNGAVVIATTTPWTAFQINSNQMVQSMQTASYYTAIDFMSPFEWNDFEQVYMPQIIPINGQWEGRIVSTGELLRFSGTTGIYRQSPHVQAVYNYYYWDLPPDAAEYAGNVQFRAVYIMKDVWGWFRCFLGLGIGSNIALHMIVAFLVMFNLYRTEKILWIPDIYPAIQRRAALRAVLLFLDCNVNNWWYPMMYTLNQGGVRVDLVGTSFRSEIPRADGLMICLGITFWISQRLRVRLRLSIVVTVYFCCFYLRIAIIDSYGLYLTYSNEEYQKRFLENILPGNGGMDLWVYHEDSRVDFKLIANEFTWLLWAIGISVGYVVVESIRQYAHPPSKLRVINVRSTKICYQKHWSQRSLLYISLSETDIDITRVERSVGRIASQLYGFIALTDDYKGQEVSISGLWLLGYVVVDNRLVLSIRDYILLLSNACLHISYFHSYGFELHGRDIATQQRPIFRNELTFHQVLNVSLKQLR